MKILLKVNDGIKDFDFSIFLNEIPFDTNTPFYYTAVLGWQNQTDNFMSINLDEVLSNIKKLFENNKWIGVELLEPIASVAKPIDGVRERIQELLNLN